MKRIYVSLAAAAIATLLLVPASIHAQKEDKDKDKTEKKEKNVETIVITKKGDSKEKVVVEINGDKITINGTPVEDYKDGEISVNRHKMSGVGHRRAFASPGNDFNYNFNEDFGGNIFQYDENAAMLGVVTEKADQGVRITEVTNESAAKKAGLKADDVITKVDDKKISDPDDLTKAIRSHKPGDKVTVHFLRDKKNQNVTAELTKWEGFSMKMDLPGMDVIAPTRVKPSTRAFAPGQGFDSYYSIVDGRPRLGLSVQDTDDGKGVKVLEVDDDGNAHKAGIKKDDVIISINDKEMNSADAVARMVKENKDKNSIMVKVNRGGKNQNIEVKMPRKLKTADL